MSRLSREAWLDHALDRLRVDGFTSLKADPLAKSLGVSRGSFYWHFDDLAVFHGAVLQHWLQVSVLSVVEQLESEGLSPAERLRSLVEIAAAGSRDLERAVRAWSLSDPAVRETVELIDQQRIAYLERLLTELGVPKKERTTRALQLYLASLGWSMVSDAVSTEDIRPVVESVLADALAVCGARQGERP